MKHLDRCPVCDANRFDVFLHRGSVPVHQNLVISEQNAAENFTRGDLQLTVCLHCGFVFNRAFELEKLSYGAAYDNTQACSPAFDRYLDGLVEMLVEKKGVRNSRVVEVGCGSGLFLRKLLEAEPSNVGIGYDPAYEGPDELYDGRLRFERRFYDASCADQPADVVICRHVIEHVPQPRPLLAAIRDATAESSRARLFFETPCVHWILRNAVIWDFFYEHCSIYSPQSLRTVFEIAQFEVASVSHQFGGQYLWLEAARSDRPVAPTFQPEETIALARHFSEAEPRVRHQWLKTIAELKGRGGVAIWGAGAKGVTIANLLDPHRELFDCVVDLNPNKQGRFLPGTGHPIVSYQALPEYRTRSVIVMNPNYQQENSSLLAAAGLDIDLVTQ